MGTNTSGDDKEIKRKHSGSHIMTAAVQMIYGNTIGLGVGPWTDEGFYQDFDFGDAHVTEKEFGEIEKKMRWIVNKNMPIKRAEIGADEARTICANDPYKLELLDEIAARGENISFYYIGESLDKAISINLCAGPHLDSTGELGAFKLMRVAGAYWRGDEKNKMLTRIYGVAFESQKELDAYVHMREEAAKRDHRKIGKELDLFTFSELVGSGLPLWTPKGALLRHELDRYVWELREKHGYVRVTIPHITKRDLYETSGHWQKFSDELFRITTREGKEYALKPMNCPHHTQIFARQPHSYREMPQRYAETTMVYRDEQSGELGGLTRVLSITQDDSHVFCRNNQVREEFFKIWDIVDTFYGTFGFTLRVRLSFHNSKTPEKYLGTQELWKDAEEALLSIAKERKADYFEAPGEAAMYGPKLDFMATDSLRREHQVATIQLDMNLPERFDLSCINEKGEKERVVMIHCAIMGSIERFVAVMLEHTAGAFPLWLSPTQVKVLSVSEKHADYAQEVAGTLKAAGIRAEADNSSESLGKKIREAKLGKVPYFIVVGDKEAESKTVTVESRDSGKFDITSLDDFIARAMEEIKTRK